jgi:tetratricopeptide (TPR) repeat protein
MARTWDSEARPRRKAAHLACVLALAFAVSPARAQDDAAKNAARELAAQGARAMESGDFASAQDLYGRAFALVPAPTLSIRQAHALEKAGRWVEALEAYVRTTRVPLDDASPAVFREAVEQAQGELAALRPRVPRLELDVSGADPKSKGLKVTLDGRPFSNALIGVESPIDPGEHEVVATDDAGHTDTKRFTATEGQKSAVSLVLPAGSDEAPAAPAPLVEPAVAPVPDHDRAPAPAAPHSSSRQTWAFVALGAGAAGLGVGVVTGLMAAGEHKTAEDECPSGRCVEGSSGAEALDAFRALRTVSTIGYVVGVVGVGAGVTLWLTRPKAEQAKIGAFVGPSSAGVRGTF